MRRKMKIHEEYFKFHDEGCERTGAERDSIVVLMEVGSFYELYGVPDEPSSAHLAKVCHLLDIHVASRRNDRVEMAGFPAHALPKYAPALVDNGYVVVVVARTSPPDAKKIVRGIAQILTSGTDFDSRREPCVASLYLEALPRSSSWVVGCAVMEVGTGRVEVFEDGGTPGDQFAGLDRVCAFLSARAPTELLLYGSTDLHAAAVAEALSSPVVTRNFCGCAPSAQVASKAYQATLLTKAYGGDDMLHVFERVNLHFHAHARAALVGLIRYVMQNCEWLAASLPPPHLVVAEDRVYMANNVGRQLQMAALEAKINRCSTAPGRRLFRDRLYRPYTSAKGIASLHDLIECEMVQGQDAVRAQRRELAKIADLDRIARRATLGRMAHADWLGLHRAATILARMGSSRFAAHEDCLALLRFVDQHLDLASSATKSGDLAAWLREDRFEPLDSARAELRRLERAAVDLEAGLVPGVFKLERVAHEGFFLAATERRLATLKGSTCFQVASQQISIDDCKREKRAGGQVRLTHPALRDLGADADAAGHRVDQRVAEVHRVLQGWLVEQHAPTLAHLSSACAALDFSLTCAANALEWGYCRPTFGAPVRLECRAMRHALVELIRDDVPFVANDVTLAEGEGMLLFGLNAAGKSTLMKAVGLCVVMAQAGMFCPCAAFAAARPFRELFTRIATGDNLEGGQSTFMVEMSEFRNILKRSSAQSLVLGDELCCGTEVASATGIVAAGIEILLERRAAFVFTTHLHSLAVQLDSPSLLVRHLHVEYDDGKGTLVYDRRLRPGPGSPTYGIEVCRALDMPEALVRRALAHRRVFLGLPEEGEAAFVPSKYNRQVSLAARCALCNAKRAQEVHHLVARRQFAARETAEPPHAMNKRSNLVPLCAGCHDDVHRDDLKLRKAWTSEGVRLMVVATDARE
jgi:DNA mismatch repair protein MutS